MAVVRGWETPQNSRTASLTAKGESHRLQVVDAGMRHPTLQFKLISIRLVPRRLPGPLLMLSWKSVAVKGMVDWEGRAASSRPSACKCEERALAPLANIRQRQSCVDRSRKRLRNPLRLGLPFPRLFSLRGRVKTTR